MKEPTQDQSLVAAIEGDFNGMSRNDLILTCQMLTRGREIWRKQCEAAEAKLDELATRTPSSELVELRRDKERLDWLQQGHSVIGLAPNEATGNTRFSANFHEQNWSEHDDVRTAIDAAKEKKP